MPLTLGAQYYRPPFPTSEYWDDDFARMRDAGLNTVQLWLVWGWIESVPGAFNYDDYDRLVELAGKHELSVVLSTIAAVHPYWIHREVPGSEMVTNMGAKVISTNRREIHYGITPGGCIDNPGVAARMEEFLRTTAERYSGVPAVSGWDVWNELRWNVHADGLVCYCDHTLVGFRDWLKTKYGDLDALNRAWERRYGAWDEVLPGKRPGRVYTEMMAFEEFISERSVEHAKWRYRIVKGANPDKPVTVHGGKPSVLYGADSYWEGEPSTALHRGNDWGFAEEIDGVGTSSFPVWEEIDHTDFMGRIDFVRGAAEANGKALWLSELQGGRSADGFNPQRSVRAADQQRWLWSGFASGADTVLFWCWRDEIFGRESGGFGIVGADGRAEERVAALARAGGALVQYDPLFSAYRLPPAEVGVWFSPRTYFHSWCEDGNAGRPMRAIQGLARVLNRLSIPYTVIEEQHTDPLSQLKVLFMPRGIVVDEPAAVAVAAFVEAGGTLVVESEAGAFGENGIYRYPEQRFLAKHFGIEEVGRRELPADVVPVSLAANATDAGATTYFLPATQWATPYIDGSLCTQKAHGEGRVVALGLYSAEAYYAGQREANAAYVAGAGEYERFVRDLVAGGGVERAARILEATTGGPLAHVRIGYAGRTPMVYVITEAESRALTLEVSDVKLAAALQGGVIDLLTRRTFSMRDRQIVLPPSEWGVMILVPGSAA
ncbi:MAG TPA: beta-galactosidase [Spirochaetia bacterium]|nr:beta-galactosidase [Spirochaetia bacterium]